MMKPVVPDLKSSSVETMKISLHPPARHQPEEGAESERVCGAHLRKPNLLATRNSSPAPPTYAPHLSPVHISAWPAPPPWSHAHRETISERRVAAEETAGGGPWVRVSCRTPQDPQANSSPAATAAASLGRF